MSPHQRRRNALCAYMAGKGIAAVVIEDFENLRTKALRYFSGHPTDAVLFVFADGRTVLIPWDVSLARERAQVDRIAPYTDYGRSFKEAVAAALKETLGPRQGARIPVELSGRTPHARYAELCSALPDFDFACAEDGLDDFVSRLRATKDGEETAALRKAARITNDLILSVTELVSSAREELTEIRMAQFIEHEALGLGAEGLGFETLAAGPRRSWAIHPFPAYTAGPFAARGLSILDFGVRVDGYTSDVTVTIARGPLSPEQELMTELVERAYGAAAAAGLRGSSPLDPARAADEVFTAAGWAMPHSLGHGIGLDAHERPYLRSRGEVSDPALLPGMAYTIEPGLYHPDHGGVRLENDVLMTETGPEILTRSGIVRL